MSEWQPIETAPKDGTVVLFHVPDHPVPFLCRADDYWDGAYWLEHATHWMAIPEPPK